MYKNGQLHFVTASVCVCVGTSLYFTKAADKFYGKNFFIARDATHMRLYADIFQRKLLERGQLPSSYVNFSEEN